MYLCVVMVLLLIGLRVCGAIMFWKSPLAEVLVLVHGCSVVVFVGDWVGGSRQLGLGERVLGMEFSVGVGLCMPEFAVQLCFGNPL